MTTIADKLLASCEELFKKGVISQPQYNNCVKSIAGSDINKQIKLTEENVFSESRLDKAQQYREFIENLKNIITNAFNELKKLHDQDSGDTDDEKKKYRSVIVQVGILLNNAIDWIQNVSDQRYQNKEESNYEQVLFYYNKIDNNRKKLNEIQAQFNTLEQRDLVQNDKYEIGESAYLSNKNITIALIIFIIITFVIIFLIYFI
jgi:hypothetical protein